MNIKYRVENDLTEENLNEFGSQGWDLVSVVNMGDTVRFYFRQILNYN